jgi:hypothetical protein
MTVAVGFYFSECAALYMKVVSRCKYASIPMPNVAILVPQGSLENTAEYQKNMAEKK